MNGVCPSALTHPAFHRFLDYQQHAKAGEAAEEGLERAFDPQQAARGAYADEAPRLEAAAQRIGAERKPLHGGDAQRRKEAMEPLAIAGGEKGGYGLIGGVGIAAGIGISVGAHLSGSAGRLVVKTPAEKSDWPRDRLAAAKTRP